MSRNQPIIPPKVLQNRPRSNQALAGFGADGRPFHGGRMVQTSHRGWMLVRTALALVMVIIGSYYISSESLLEKYAVPGGDYLPASRVMMAMDPPLLPVRDQFQDLAKSSHWPPSERRTNPQYKSLSRAKTYLKQRPNRRRRSDHGNGRTKIATNLLHFLEEETAVGPFPQFDETWKQQKGSESKRKGSNGQEGALGRGLMAFKKPDPSKGTNKADMLLTEKPKAEAALTRRSITVKGVKQEIKKAKNPTNAHASTPGVGVSGAKMESRPKDSKTEFTEKHATAFIGKDNQLPKTLVDENILTSNNANTSYVHYTGCCGLGHRLARMSSAHHAAQRLNFALRGTWPSCHRTNVYQYLFEDDDWAAGNYSRTGQVVTIHNEVPGYATVSRAQPQKRSNSSDTCGTCHPEKIDSDYRFYNQLLQRFRKRDQVEAFVTKHKFADHVVIGMHTRAGNGEGGDFEQKGRGIANTTQFVERVRQHVLSLIKENDWKDPPLLFLATDTAAMVRLFRQAMADDDITVVELPQIRATEGGGILFGDKKSRMRRRMFKAGQKPKEREEGADDDQVNHQDEQLKRCLLGWDQAFMDMMLLASADVILATRRSSFVQTIPLSIMMGRNERKVNKPYCEVSQDSLLEMTCHSSYMEWCCCQRCVANELEELEQHQANKRQGVEYIKQLRSDLWDMPAMELYQKNLKKTSKEELQDS